MSRTLRVGPIGAKGGGLGSAVSRDDAASAVPSGLVLLRSKVAERGDVGLFTSHRLRRWLECEQVDGLQSLRSQCFALVMGWMSPFGPMLGAIVSPFGPQLRCVALHRRGDRLSRCHLWTKVQSTLIGGYCPRVSWRLGTPVATERLCRRRLVS